MTDPTVADVVHNTAESRFELILDGHLAELGYRLDGDKIVFEHTRVADELGGRGIGGLLAKAGIDHAASNGLTVVPTCPFVKGWLEKHPDEAARVTIEQP
jgi:predicted GNAT family acetyltransferase